MTPSMGFVLRLLCLAGLTFAPLTAAAQNAGPPRASSGIASIVNEVVISNYDLDQRVALYIATSGLRATAENLPQIRTQVLRALQDETIELQEANKHRISVTRAELDKAVQNIAEDNRLSVAQLLGTLERAGVAATSFVKQVNAQMIWQKLVAIRYGPDIAVGEQQLDEAMDRLKLGADKPQFLLSEIYIAVDRPEDETAIRASAQQIADQARQGAPFQAIAGQFSQSPSAADGGDIGWLAQGELDEELDRALLPLRPGQIAGPVRAEGGYYVLLLRDRREPAGTVQAEPASVPNPDAPVPLDRFLIPLPANPDDVLKERAMALAVSVKGQVRACSDLPTIAAQLQGTVHQKLGDMNPKDLNPDLRSALAKTGPGETVNPFFSPAGLELIVRCDVAPAKFGVVQLPSREELRQQLSAQKMSVYAKSYLRDLRRSAIVYGAPVN